MKKKLLALVLSTALVAMAIVGGTFAYLSDEVSDVNVMTMGNVYIEQFEYERNSDGDLVEFTQAKPAYPVVGNIAWDAEKLNVNGFECDVFDSNLKNVVDKIVTVKNTGKSDAYVRTIIAVEAPEFDKESLIHVNINGAGITYGDWINATIGGTDYSILVATYDEAVEPGKFVAPSLMQVFLDSKADNDYCNAFGDTWEILVVSQAVQTAGFDDPATALNTAFGEITVNNLPWDTDYVAIQNVTVSTNEELKAALTGSAGATTFALTNAPAPEVIHVTLAADLTYDVAAWDKDAMGGEETKMVIIDGADHTLTFNQTNSDWNNIVMANEEGTLVLTNMNVTNSGHNNGPWNRHDLNFACNVQLTNVNSDKAMAFKADAKLENVTINDKNTSDTYAIWIQPKGQTVALNNVTIDMKDCSDGRGIKIDEQYVGEEDIAKVTLLVNNTTFITEEKAAILVKSIKGADIVLNNIDISKVESDYVFPVWVDEASKEYAGLVTVTGGVKVVEGEADGVIIPAGATKEETNKAVNEEIKNAESGDIIYLPQDVEISLPSLANKEGLTIVGTGETVIGGDDTTTGFGSNFGKDTTIKGINFIGSSNGVRYSYAKGGNTVFEDCTFAGDSVYGFHIDQSNGANFTFNNCTFIGFNAFAGDLASVTFNNCTFLHNGNYGHTNIWSVGYFNNCTWGDKTSVSPGSGGGTLYFNGVEESKHHEFIGSADSLVAFAKSVNEGKDSWKNQYVVLVADIDLAGIDWEPIGQTGATEFKGIFDGNGYTIKNLSVDSVEHTDEHYSSGLFGWAESNVTIKNVTIDGATVKGNHNVAAIVGYTYSGKIINCHVANATIVCTHANGEACGDKAGTIAGYTADEARIADCSATNSTVTAGRDAGQLLGLGYNVSVSNCTATNVTVTAGGDCTGANIRNEVVGRVMG